MAEEGTPNSGDGASREAAPKKPWREMNREEAMERFDAYHAKQRANRRRMTGDDVQEMLRQRRADRRQRRSERRERRHNGQAPQRDTGQVVRMSLGGALMVGAIGTGALAATSTDTTEVQSRDNDLEIASLEGEIRELEAASWDEGDAAALEEQLDEAVDQAREKGEEVAELQTTYQEILADLDDAELSGDGEGDGGGDEALAPVSEHRAKLVDYFDESARIVENEDAYRPGADVPHGPGEIDVLFPWYIRYADEHRDQYAEASLNSWELVSATPRIGSQGTVTVAWLNSDASSGDLLAWARGTYDAEAGAFISVSVGQTTIGDRFAGGAGQDEEDQD
ncbi:hypothetical protein [Nocardiopsis sp. NRRL B-16309]|uniref:hypothetical protein n=1 Tax=Nocardiopsis sp. NRRL B-16309 TaxID=1519494 RepID=UPI0006AF9174|nr:hypothetical protein [Nocardiopsis sp. NRRL B-16309]KOX14014.1 hypothetical protein ADL05_17380 [Nocardiopsis sp. NRRL B-16309]